MLPLQNLFPISWFVALPDAQSERPGEKPCSSVRLTEWLTRWIKQQLYVGVSFRFGKQYWLMNQCRSNMWTALSTAFSAPAGLTESSSVQVWHVWLRSFSEELLYCAGAGWHVQCTWLCHDPIQFKNHSQVQKKIYIYIYTYINIHINACNIYVVM